MKKRTAILVIMVGLLSFNASASAFWSWDDITNAFETSFIGRLFFDDIEEEKIPEKKSKESERLKQIKEELRILQEGGVEALKKYEKSNLSFFAKEEGFDESTQKVLDKVEETEYEEEYEGTSNGAPVEVIEIPMYFDCDTVVTEFSPTRKYYFATLPFGSQNKHIEILRYKIKWFDGTWSGWFIPGRNDKDWQGDQHFWANFADHYYEVEHCENYQYSAPQ